MITRYLNFYWPLLLGAAVSGGGCDKTVGIDAERPSFSKLLVPSACSNSSDDLSRVDISVLMLDRHDAILPDDRLQFETETIGEMLKPANFHFSSLSDNVSGKPGWVAAEGNPNASQASSLDVKEVSFLYTGGKDRKDDNRLVILLLDHSESLMGETKDGSLDTQYATDARDERISFFNQLLQNLPSDDYVSLAWFNSNVKTNIDGVYAYPSRNREIMKAGLDQLSRNEAGKTPLADALSDVFDSIIKGNYKNWNPIVVLFTDGVEGGDTSTHTLDDVVQQYTSLTEPVPIIVLELQPPEAVQDAGRRGRHSDLMDLACKTGGEYFFISSPTQFTDTGTNLEQAVLNRLAGVWRLNTQTDLQDATLFPANQGYLLSTSLEVTLGEKKRSANLSNNDGTSDSRLWFYKK